VSPSAQPASVDAYRRTTRLLLVLVLALAAFIQLTVITRTVVDHPLRADAGEYFSYAWNLSQDGIYSSARPGSEGSTPTPDKVRTPGYPLFLIAIGPPEPTEAYLRRVSLVQALLGVGSVWLAYLIAASFLGRGWALAPALLAATSPHLAMSSTYVLTESLFTFLLLASTYASIKTLASRHWRHSLLAGALWGACALVRPTVQFLPLVFLGLALLVPALRALRRSAVFLLLGFVAVMSPWVVRNLGVEQPGPSLMVNSIAHGAYPGFTFEDRPETFGFPYRFDPAYPDHIRSGRTLAAHLADRFSSEPARYLQWFLLGKPYFFLSLRDVQSLDIQIYPTPANPYYERPLFAWMRGLHISAHWPLMIAGMLGILVAGLRGRSANVPEAAALRYPAMLVALVVLYAIALHMVAAPFPRYAIPFRPLIYALAMLPFHAAWLAWGRRHRA
jgi:4-amino-4-deoxy-L-arabinose transferase-like glycosyltransferase